jgi:hypothetical protein
LLPRREAAGMGFQMIIERKQADEKGGKKGIIFAEKLF